VQNSLYTSWISTAVLAAAGAGGGILAAEQVHGPSKIMYAALGSLAVAGATIGERLLAHGRCKKIINTNLRPTPEVNNKVAFDDRTASVLGLLNGGSVFAGLALSIGHNFPEGVSTVAPNVVGFAGSVATAVSVVYSRHSANKANIAYQNIIDGTESR
jgi:hypothetical protein